MATNTRQSYFDPLVLAKISTMTLRARHVVEGLLSGLHQSPYRGYSVEFAEHREYVPGDEIRRIDWKAYGKFDRYFVKEYEEETNLRAYLLLDASASMDYGTAGLRKFDYGCYLAVSLAYLMLRQGDDVGLVTFGAQVQRYIPPRCGMQHMQALTSHLEMTQPQGETHLDQVLQKCRENQETRDDHGDVRPVRCSRAGFTRLAIFPASTERSDSLSPHGQQRARISLSTSDDVRRY